MDTSPPPRGFGPAGKIRVAWSFENWAQKPEVREAWAVLKKRHGLVLERDPFDTVKDVFGLLDAEVLGPWARSNRCESPFNGHLYKRLTTLCIIIVLVRVANSGGTGMWIRMIRSSRC